MSTSPSAPAIGPATPSDRQYGSPTGMASLQSVAFAGSDGSSAQRSSGDRPVLSPSSGVAAAHVEAPAVVSVTSRPASTRLGRISALQLSQRDPPERDRLV